MKSVMFADDVIAKHHFHIPFISLRKALVHTITGGTLLQVIGAKSTGKTSLALHMLTANQNHVNVIPVGKRKATACFVDLERSFDPVYAQQLGVDLSTLILLKPATAEEGMVTVESLLKEGLQLFVWDSVPAIVTKDEIEKTMDDPVRMAGSANIFSRWLVRLMPQVDDADALFMFINQWRKNLAPMARTDKKPFGPEALGYYSKVIVELTRIKNERDAGISTVELLVTKNKIGAEGGRAQLQLQHGYGFSYEQDVFDLAVTAGVVQRDGARYTYNDLKAHGKQQALTIFPLNTIAAQLEC